jgi:hypothetical protein
MHTRKLETTAVSPPLGDFAFAWWCRRCGFYLPVDDTDHCRDCAYMRGPVRGVNGSHRHETVTNGKPSEAAP